MKRIACIFTITILSFNIYCQNDNTLPMVEINLGVNYLLENNNIKPKLNFGMSIKSIWFPKKTFNLISGLLFEKTKYLDSFVQCSHYCYYRDMEFNIYSFSIPLMLRAYSGEKQVLFIETGPTFEIIPFKWGKGIEVSHFPNSNPVETNISGDFEHSLTDFGVNIGIGARFQIENYKFVMTFTYHNSIKLILQKQQNNLTEYCTLKIGTYIN